MLRDFLHEHRDALIARCEAKVAKRPGPRPTDRPPRYGIPLFLDQVITALRLEQTAGPSVPIQPRPPPTPSDIGRPAAQHGGELHRTGFTVDQVVHDYGDLCQSVTEMAIEHDTTVTADE